MTKEQINQSAEISADKFYGYPHEEEISHRAHYVAGYIAGALVYEEEVKKLNASIVKLMCERDSIKSESEYLINQLNSQWINAKEQKPPLYVDRKGEVHPFSERVIVLSDDHSGHWHVAEYYSEVDEWCCVEHPTFVINNVTYWKQIQLPKLSK